MPEELKERLKREYRENETLVIRLIWEYKESRGKDFGWKISEKYMENKKLCIMERNQEGNGREKNNSL